MCIYIYIYIVALTAIVAQPSESLQKPSAFGASAWVSPASLCIIYTYIYIYIYIYICDHVPNGVTPHSAASQRSTSHRYFSSALQEDVTPLHMFVCLKIPDSRL